MNVGRFVFGTVREALTGSPHGIGVGAAAELLGRAETLRRLRCAIIRSESDGERRLEEADGQGQV